MRGCASTASAQPAPSSSASSKSSGAPSASASATVSAEPAPPTPDAKANAESLFLRGQKLLEAGNYEQACPLLAESLRLDFGLGTLLYLSDCQEQLGQTASAWAGFKEAEELARAKGQTEREQRAKSRAQALEPKLAMLKVIVADENKAIGIVVKRNGVPVGEAAWGEPLPVDPGAQRLEASAPGYATWSETVDIPVGPGESEQKIPALTKLKDSDLPKSSSGIDGRAMRISGLTIGAAGIVTIIIGAGFGIDAILTYNEAIDTCENEDPTLCTNTGVRLQEDASRSALVSTIAFSVGAVTAAGGALLFFLAPKTPVAAPKVGAWADSQGFFLTLGGSL